MRTVGGVEGHGVNEGMLGWKASQIMASLRGSGCDMTGKLRRDQPHIFAPQAG